MPSKRCTVCGNKVNIPAKIESPAKFKKEEQYEQPKVKCDSCGAEATLRVRRRNGNVRGLKGSFGSVMSFFKKY